MKKLTFLPFLVFIFCTTGKAQLIKTLEPDFESGYAMHLEFGINSATTTSAYTSSHLFSNINTNPLDKVITSAVRIGAGYQISRHWLFTLGLHRYSQEATFTPIQDNASTVIMRRSQLTYTALEARARGTINFGKFTVFMDSFWGGGLNNRVVETNTDFIQGTYTESSFNHYLEGNFGVGYRLKNGFTVEAKYGAIGYEKWSFGNSIVSNTSYNDAFRFFNNFHWNTLRVGFRKVF